MLTTRSFSSVTAAMRLRSVLLSLLLLAGFIGPQAYAQKAAASAATPIKVYLVGTFHFNGSDLDVVKSGKTDMQSPEKQQELEDLANRLAKTRADKVFVEWKPTMQRYVDSTYALYRQGRFALKNNEVFQVGYRLANKLNRPRVICADADGEWNYTEAVDYAKQHGQYKILENSADDKPAADSVGLLIEARLRAIAGPKKAPTTNPQTITSLMVLNNTDTALREMMAWYQLTGARVGGGASYVGADLGGDFYKRNMRIYANLLRAVDVQHDKSIILIIGAGHVGFLRQVLQYNPLFEVQDVLPLLTAK